MVPAIRIRRIVAGGFAVFIATAPMADAQAGIERKVLLQRDLAVPGYETVLVSVTIAVGGREGRHTHAGTLIGQVLDGELTLESEGRPTVTYRAGDSISVEPGQVHEGINLGKTPVKALVTFIVEKGKPLTTQVR